MNAGTLPRNIDGGSGIRIICARRKLDARIRQANDIVRRSERKPGRERTPRIRERDRRSGNQDTIRRNADSVR